MGPIWQKINAQREALQKAGLPSYECERKAIPNMTMAEAVAALNEAVETIKRYSDDIRSIRGWQRDPDCTAQLAMNNKCVANYQREINTYGKITDERFQAIFPTLTFRGVPAALVSLRLARDTLVFRGPRYNPPH